jgi:hypothetical protein
MLFIILVAFVELTSYGQLVLATNKGSSAVADDDEDSPKAVIVYPVKASAGYTHFHMTVIIYIEGGVRSV